MNARLSSDRDWTSSAPASTPDERVLSVSPRRVIAEAGMAHVTPTEGLVFPHSSPQGDAAGAGDAHGMPLEPVNVGESDAQASLDRFAAELSAMIEVAACTADTLNRRMQEAGEGESRAAATGAQLQEQLRTGARMLKAFQSQIARVEHTIEKQEAYERQVAEVQSKIEQCFAGIETCVDRTLESVALRLAELAQTAMRRFEEGIAQREVRLAEIDSRIAQCATGLDGICEMIEQAQGSAAAAVSANQHTLEQLEDSATASRQLLEQHEQARRSLTGDLRALEEGLQSLEARGVAHGEAASQSLRLAAEADATLRARLVDIEQAASETERIAESATALNDLLVRLEPWEGLLLSGKVNADGLPEPLAKVAGEVRQQITRDMTWLSDTMKDVAQRVSQLAQVPAVGSTPARTRPAARPARADDSPASAPAAAEPPVETPANTDPASPEVTVKKPLRLRSFKTGS
jgi:chromosome segregation ATPase